MPSTFPTLPWLMPTLISIGLILLIRLYFYSRNRSQANASALQLQQSLTLLEQRLQQSLHQQTEAQTAMRVELQERLHSQQQLISDKLHQFAQVQAQDKAEQLQRLQTSMLQSFGDLRQQLTENLQQSAHTLNQRMSELAQITEQRLQGMSQQVEQRLQTGFEQSTETFTKIVERLTMIDAAQQKITELSVNVVSLQDLLSDKRARGAFGEVQLANLIQNVLPPQAFQLQSTLSNQKRVDCLLLLPEPAGNMAIDAKFPLETYRLLQEATDLPEPEQKALAQRFRQDIRKHIQDIASKYIIPGETADSAMLFIPAEAIFAHIHSQFADVVDYAHQMRVWLVSPTTMMAVLTTAKAVIKDAATRQQVHLIQVHLRELGTDFERFRKRMDKLATHIKQAHEDADLVQTSAHKIGQRFDKIEAVELAVDSDDKVLTSQM